MRSEGEEAQTDSGEEKLAHGGWDSWRDGDEDPFESIFGVGLVGGLLARLRRGLLALVGASCEIPA